MLRATLIALAAAFPAAGQVAYRSVAHIAPEQRVLPATGPGSALRNPAALAETRLAHVQYGRFYATRGKAGTGFGQASVTLPTSLWPAFPLAFAAGLGAADNDAKIDNSNAVYREAAWTSPASAAGRSSSVPWPGPGSSWRRRGRPTSPPWASSSGPSSAASGSSRKAASAMTGFPSGRNG